MALNSPPSVEVEQIQFKIHDKFKVFQSNDIIRSNINLLATSCTNGLIFVGNPNKEEIKVIQLKTLVESRENDRKLYARTFQIPSKPNCIAVSCDGLYLSVNYTLRGSEFLALYYVPSFYTHNIIQKFVIKISSEDNVDVIQLLWNPIISTTLALVLNDGAVGMYNFKDTNYEFHSLDKSQEVFCGCWSPKGKQIVLGFRNGKIAQYKPDLKLARLIECPSNIVDGSFKTIAIQWLSTYQFAVSYLQDGDSMMPNLYIVNAPKSGQPTYINYYDICYSGSGPRQPQVFFIHLQSWNVLLVANSNSMEVGILGTSENGEAPNWTEYNLNDSCRLNLPMTKDKQETHPIGFCLETGSTHQLIIGENEIPVMPMIHVLSTHGELVTFDFLNLFPNSPGICFLPSPVCDQSGLINFKEVVVEQSEINSQNQVQQNDPNMFGLLNANKNSTNMQGFGGLTSTPAKSNFFMQSQAIGQPQTGFSIGGSAQSLFTSNSSTTSSIVPSFGNQPEFGGGITLGDSLNQSMPFSNNSTENQNKPFSGFGNIKAAPITEANSFTTINNPDKNKPLYTVQPNFIPPKIEKSTEEKIEPNKNIVNQNDKINLRDPVNYDYIQEMIQTEIQCFELELKELSSKSKDINISIGNMENIKNYTKKLGEFQGTVDDLKEIENETDVQVLRHSVNECFTMIAEVRSKLELFENPELLRKGISPSNDQASRRQLARLNSMLATNENYLKVIKQQVDANWSDFQDIVHRNSSTRMHIPSLEGIYQTMTKQKSILGRERQKIAHIKSKLNFPGLQLETSTNKNIDSNADSLADSILSMSLSEQIFKENSKLNNEKLQIMREALQNRKIIKITPQRPDRLQSEVILKSKIKTKKIETSKPKLENEFSNVLSPSVVSILTPQTFNKQQLDLKPQYNHAAISFSSSKPLESKPIGNSFGNLGQNLAMPSTSVTDNKISASTSTIFFSKSQNSTIPTNNTNQAVTQTKTFGVPKVSSSAATAISAPGFSFSNFTNTVAPNKTFGNTGNVGTFTPVNSIQSFGGSASGLTFNVKTTTTSQNLPRTQISQIITAPPAITGPKPTTFFQTSNLASVFSVSNSSTSNITAPTFSSNVDSRIFSTQCSEIQSKPDIVLVKNAESSAADSFLENLNICKPAIKTPTTAASSTNIFGSGVFSLNSQISNNQNVISSEAKTSFLSTFSSTSKSPIFGSTPLVTGSNNNTSSPAPLPFSFIQTSSAASTSSSADTVSNKSVFTSIAVLSSTTNNDISQSPSVLSFGSSFQSANQIGEKNEQQATTDAQLKTIGVTLPNTPLNQNATIDSSTTAVTSSIFGNLTLNSSTTNTLNASSPSLKSPTMSETSVFKSQLPTATSDTEAGNKTLISSSPFTPFNPATTSSVVLSPFMSTSTSATSFYNSPSTTAPASTTPFSSLSLTSSTFPSLGVGSTNTTVALTSTSTISFSVPSTSTSSVGSLFSTITSTVSSNSIFAGSLTTTEPSSTTTTTINTGNIFSGIPKPDQSVFNQGSFDNIFAQAALTSPFGQKPASTTTTPSIFGGGTTTAFGGINKSSTFGNDPTTNPNSVFSTPSEQKTDTPENIFGTPTNSTTMSGSIFARSPFSLNSNTGEQQNSSNIFGGGMPSGNVSFGSNNGSSIFGGGATNSNTPAPTSPFSSAGSFSSGLTAGTGLGVFGTNTVQNQAGMTFDQGNAASSTSFGSPNASFGNPSVFGAPTFGSGAPTFGGVPTFGSGIKNLGSFANPTNSNQSSNLFGASNDSLSFGNLAQNANANSSKPNFVPGSSFSNWR